MSQLRGLVELSFGPPPPNLGAHPPCGALSAFIHSESPLLHLQPTSKASNDRTFRVNEMHGSSSKMQSRHLDCSLLESFSQRCDMADAVLFWATNDDVGHLSERRRGRDPSRSTTVFD